MHAQIMQIIRARVDHVHAQIIVDGRWMLTAEKMFRGGAPASHERELSSDTPLFSQLMGPWMRSYMRPPAL
jgi:hypothetical protein